MNGAHQRNRVDERALTGSSVPARDRQWRPSEEDSSLLRGSAEPNPDLAALARFANRNAQRPRGQRDGVALSVRDAAADAAGVFDDESVQYHPDRDTYAGKSAGSR